MRIPGRLTALQAGETVVVALHLRRVDFGVSACPEVELAGTEALGDCADAPGLVRLLDRLPGWQAAKFSWWALDLLETCTSCARRFDTSQRHWALAISIEARSAVGKELIACWYPARFCVRCQSPDQPVCVWSARQQ